MQIDKKDIEKLSNLEDAVLKERLGAIMDEIGVDNRRRRKILSDIPNLKKQALNLTNDDLSRLGDMISAHDKDDLARRIKDAANGK